MDYVTLNWNVYKGEISMEQTIMKTENDRLIAVGGEKGGYFPVMLTRVFNSSSTDFDLKTTRIAVEDLTPLELVQYNYLKSALN